MACISPLSLKHGDVRTVVPCGVCNFCLQVKRGEWTFRLKEELRVCDSAYFLTLSYDDKHLPAGGSLVKAHMQNFMKRLRKFEGRRVNRPPLRYYSVGEYGTKFGRPHYHSIMFNMSVKTLNALTDIWSHGYVHVGEVTGASIHYVTKYHLNKHHGWDKENGDKQKPFCLISNRSGGIGFQYLARSAKWHHGGKVFYVVSDGVKQAIPRYYKDKIFSKHVKEVQRVKSVTESDRKHSEELQRLSKFVTDPFAHLEERIRYAHESSRRKENKNDKF